MISIILLVLAVVCFVVAAAAPGHPHWNRLLTLGLASFAASFLRF